MQPQAKQPARRRWGIVRLACGLMITCVWIGAAGADPPTTQPAAETTPTHSDAGPTTPAPAPEPGRTPARPSVRTVPAPRSDYEPDPNAKWACEQTEVELDPIWRQGSLNLTFNFTIHNEGTADLKIKAKGG